MDFEPSNLAVISAGDFSVLKALHNAGSKGFQPMGWLYRSVLAVLVERGLLIGFDTFRITPLGEESLKAYEAAQVVSEAVSGLEPRR